MYKNVFAGLLLMTVSLGVSAGAYKAHARYEVTITNITPGQTFTPQLVVTHPREVSLFELGEPASVELEILAEGGDTAPLTESVADQSFDAQTIGGLLGPGESSSIVVSGPKWGGYLSVAAMLIPTNDNFFAVNGLRLPFRGASTVLVPAYDAGTEYNDQSCQNIPGPRCGGEGYSAEPAEGDEGFVHIGNGFHEIGDFDSNGFEVLGPKVYDWKNSVAKVTVKRVR